MSTLFGSEKCLTAILKLTQESGKSRVKTLVCFDEPSEVFKGAATKQDMLVYAFHREISERKAESHLYNAENYKGSRTTDDVFTISYTSGTSGNPKGVVLTNGNFLSAITNVMHMASGVGLSHTDIYISYLPLAHVFDRLGIHTLLSQGASIGFFGGVLLQITEDLGILKPTVFPSVPRLLNKVYDRVTAAVSERPWYARAVFY